MIIHYLLRYWRKYIKNALAMLFSGVLLTVVVFVGLTIIRENRANKAHSLLDKYSHAEIFIANSNDEIFEKVTEGKSGYNYGVMYVYGTSGGFAYGTIEDEHNIWHIPFEEGRMPETADEIAVDRGALNSLFWVGKCGDTITLDGKTYTVVGIIDEVYGQQRRCSQLNKENSTIEEQALPYKTPLIFVGECDGEPLYRLDIFNNIFDLNASEDAYDNEWNRYKKLLRGYSGNSETRWFLVYTQRDYYSSVSEIRHDNQFFLKIVSIGVIISALSVFSILRSIFSERKNRIEILKRIGMSKRSIALMYAVECALFSVIQIILGIALGFAVYEGVLKFRTDVLEEKVYSGITNLWLVTHNTTDPFLYSALISAAIIVIAYILCIITDRIHYSAPDKNTEPRPLSKCFKRVFSHKAVTVTQTAALTLICFSVLMGYMYYTDNGKKLTVEVIYLPSKLTFNVNGLNMEDNNIAEYYSSSKPTVNYLGESEPSFPFIVDGFSAGIDDNTADTLPEYAMPSGNLTQTFIASEKRNNRYINEIDTSTDYFRQGLLSLSPEEHQNFFDEGQLGSMYLYSVETKLTTARLIESLTEKVVEGELNIDKLNSGEEIIVAYKGAKPPFEIGETVLLNSIAATETGYGIGEISSAEVKIAAFLRFNREEDKLINSVIRNKEDYNLLTTATGAENMGLHCAKYTDIYTSEPMNGGLIPSSAQMTMKSLEIMKHDYFINQLIKYSSSILILIVMSLLGISAYFNGIGMKIRLKKYEISVLRAVGTNLEQLRKKLLFESMKIPLLSTAAAYVFVKLLQLFGWITWNILMWYEDNLLLNQPTPPSDFIREIYRKIFYFAKTELFIDGLMWQTNAEIPALILLAILLAVTFLLTIIALRKFKGNIAGDLSDGRTRQ